MLGGEDNIWKIPYVSLFLFLKASLRDYKILFQSHLLDLLVLFLLKASLTSVLDLDVTMDNDWIQEFLEEANNIIRKTTNELTNWEDENILVNW